MLNVLPLEHCSLNTSHQPKACNGNHFQNLTFLRATILPRARAFYSAGLRLTTIRKTFITRLETTLNVQSQYLLTNIFMFCFVTGTVKKITFVNKLKFSSQCLTADLHTLSVSTSVLFISFALLNHKST